MKCPFCFHGESKVLDSRSTEENASIRRRRECLDCGRRFTTYERLDEIPFMVVKKDGRREDFSRSKLLNGCLRACEKRPISSDEIESLVDRVEKELRQSCDREVSSDKVGEFVMKHLRELDQVAYVRFASVYREFKDIKCFVEELQYLLGGK